LTPDGKHRWRRHQTIFLRSDPAGEAVLLGARLGAEIAAEAGPLYRAHFGDRGW
jgi:hypothetical protein